MCNYNTGCPGHPTDDGGFTPCESAETCASSGSVAQPRDICIYCMRDQGPINPETGWGWSRIGYNCYWCGSN